MVIGLGRLGGRTVGLLANNPLRMGGCLDSASAEKAARFVRMCDSFGVPLVVAGRRTRLPTRGRPGMGTAWSAEARKLLHAFAEAVVPRVTLVTRKILRRRLHRDELPRPRRHRVFAWPDAEVAVMEPKPRSASCTDARWPPPPPTNATRCTTNSPKKHERIAGGVNRALAIGVVDEVIEPHDTRRRLVQALAEAPAGRGSHGNIPL